MSAIGNDTHEQTIKRVTFLLCVDKTPAVQDVEEQAAEDDFYLYMNHIYSWGVRLH